MNGRDESATDRLAELESRVAFQDDLVESLNDVLVRQDRELARLLSRVQALEARLEELSDAAAMPGTDHGQEVPPHY